MAIEAPKWPQILQSLNTKSAQELSTVLDKLQTDLLSPVSLDDLKKIQLLVQSESTIRVIAFLIKSLAEEY
jgi:hypothetical protein